MDWICMFQTVLEPCARATRQMPAILAQWVCDIVQGVYINIYILLITCCFNHL